VSASPCHSAAPRFRHRSFLLVSILWTALCIAASPASAARAVSLAANNAEPNAQIGIASWYGAKEAGRRTASGAIFDPRQPTAAHRTLPLGTCVRVTHLGNGHFVVVPIIDRGPYIHGRLIDLSEIAAQRLGMKQAGLAQVRITVVPSCLKEVKTRPIARA
jgi:rare lipoprotein A